MGTRNQSPDADVAVPTRPGATPPSAADPGPEQADAGSELMCQFEELDRCLARMDAVVSMLEADLERRAAAWQALDPEISATLATAAEWRRRQRKRRHRAMVTRSRRARRGR